MKKFYLLVWLTSVTLGFSQQLISFESNEGYAPGDINGQDNGNWSTTEAGLSFIENQIITEEDARDGLRSLKLVNESSFLAQNEPNIGAFYAFSPISSTDLIISWDIKIDDNPTPSRYKIDFVDSSINGSASYISFEENGDIWVLTNLEGDGSGSTIESDTGENWAPNTWYNIRIEITGLTLELYIDNALSFTGNTANPGVNVDEISFLHNNKNSIAFIDTVRINNEALSIGSNQEETNNFRFASSTRELLLSSTNSVMTDLVIYNSIGQAVHNRKLSNRTNTISLEHLRSGVYIAHIRTSKTTETLKFLIN